VDLFCMECRWTISDYCSSHKYCAWSN